MKRVLITGANSYIGTNVERWLLKEPEKYHVETLDMKDPNWVNFDFSKFDVVFHVAGIVHMKEKRSARDMYFKVNRDLAINVAVKSKDSGVKQFIFMSSMSVYGILTGIINKDTIPNPKNYYGKTKYEAENGIKPLEDKNFTVTILRPPMIYGPNSKGNFPRLIKLTKKTFIFPKIQNKRSMLYIDNLSNSVKYLIDEEKEGTYFPQNSDYMCTTEMVKIISKKFNKKIWIIKCFNPFIYIFKNHFSSINKLFGNLIYDFELSKATLNSNVVSSVDSILLSLN